MKQIAQGAEAKIYVDFLSSKFFNSPTIIKDRTPKSYRLKELDDKLRSQRTKSESKILIKAQSAGVNVPKVDSINKEKFQIYMQYIQGERLSETLNSKPLEAQIKIIRQIAEQVAKLHNNNIIHSDLTTSNTILINPAKQNPHQSADNQLINKLNNKIAESKLSAYDSEPAIFIIDFGLSFISQRIEDKAVDVHLIKQALEAKHWQNWEVLFQEFIKAYNPKEKTQILERLKKVESRGRYKHSCE